MSNRGLPNILWVSVFAMFKFITKPITAKEILQDITTCTTLYRTNLCGTSPIPAMVHQCATWETCMSRDPKVVGRAKVGAEMLAEVVNGFVEPISWKTLVGLSYNLPTVVN